MAVYFELLICAVIIFIGANLLTRYADILAEKLNLSRSWVGVVFLAAITSLPELSNSMGASLVVKQPDLGIGNLLGASLMNILLIALMDYLNKNKPIFSQLDSGHILSSGYAVLLLTLAGLGILSSSIINAHLVAFAIFIIYLVSQRQIFIFERGKILQTEKIHAKQSLPIVMIKFIFMGLLVVITGVWLSNLGNALAIQTGWGATFIGSFVLSLITTLPELTVSWSAMRLGAPDMAVSNLLGSILFNVALISVIDPFYRQAPLLGAVSALNVLTVLTCIICLSIVVVGVIKHSKKKAFLGLSLNSLLIILTTFISWYLLFIIQKA